MPILKAIRTLLDPNGKVSTPWSNITVEIVEKNMTNMYYVLVYEKYQPIVNNGVVSNWLQCKKHTSFKRQVKMIQRWDSMKLWRWFGDTLKYLQDKGGFNHHTTKNIQCIVNIAFLECEYEIYQKNEETIYLSLDISHLQLLRSCFHAVTCLYRFKKSKSLPLDLRLCQDA